MVEEHWVQLTNKIYKSGDGQATEYHKDKHGAVYLAADGHIAVCTPLRWVHSDNRRSTKAATQLQELILVRIKLKQPLTDIRVCVRSTKETTIPYICAFTCATSKEVKEQKAKSLAQLKKEPKFGMF